MRAVASEDTTIVWVVLVHSTFTHGGNKDGKVELVNELVNLLDNTMADSTRIDKDDRALSSVHSLEDLINDEVLVTGVVLRLRQVDGGVKSSTLNLLLDHIGRDHDVDGARAEPASAESSIDLLGNLGGLVELGDVARDLSAHVGKDIKVTVSESVVKKHLVTLRDGRRASNNVDDGDVLGVRASNAVDGRELTNTEGGDESSHLGDTCISISSVGSVKLVNTADPLEVALRKIVEGDEVVVAGNTVNRSNTDFVETLEEVFSHVNWLLEVGGAHDCGLTGKLLGEITDKGDKVDMMEG